MVQFSADVRDEAVQLARGFGREHAVDVWYTDRSTYRLLEAYRPRTLVHAAESSAADIERVRR